ncbi:MAG: hypothetical protein LBH25_09760 [Fibromonadaceae bacterium]|jgi:guanylate kinase|nr:hypothetical protein [Fibromonadaceae bacterium]
MGHIYVLAGPSGVGKTTFLNELSSNDLLKSLKILQRVTTRSRRPGEEKSSLRDYRHCSKEEFFQNLANNIFLPPYCEKYEEFFYGIDKNTIDSAVSAEYDSILTSGINAAVYLKGLKEISDYITIIFMYTGDYSSIKDPKVFGGISASILIPDNSGNFILNPNFCSDTTEEIVLLVKRLMNKYKNGEFEQGYYNNESDYINKRMDSNYIDLAYVIGKLKETKENKEPYIKILINKENAMNNTIKQFQDIVENKRNLNTIPLSTNTERPDVIKIPTSTSKQEEKYGNDDSFNLFKISHPIMILEAVAQVHKIPIDVLKGEPKALATYYGGDNDDDFVDKYFNKAEDGNMIQNKKVKIPKEKDLTYIQKILAYLIYLIEEETNKSIGYLLKIDDNTIDKYRKDMEKKQSDYMNDFNEIKEKLKIIKNENIVTDGRKNLNDIANANKISVNNILEWNPNLQDELQPNSYLKSGLLIRIKLQ